MNWFRGNESQDSPNHGNPSSTPDANELRRRRLAKLEEAQAAEKARRKELEERKAKWEAEKAMREAAAPKPAPPPPPPKEPEPEPEVVPEPQPKRQAPALPSIEAAVSKVVGKSLGIATNPLQAIGGLEYVSELVLGLKADAGLADDQPLHLTADDHGDDILLNRINGVKDPLAYLLACYTRCGQQVSEINSNRRIAGDEHKERRERLYAEVAAVQRLVMAYSGMLLSGSFMDDDAVKPEAFAEAVISEKIPTGFIRAILQYYFEQGEAGTSEILPIFSRVFKFLRDKAKMEMKLSSNSFLKPLKALLGLLQHKELCVSLTSELYFLPASATGAQPMHINKFVESSFLSPFFVVSALPGLPLHMPLQVEDPDVGRSMFPNPTMLDRATAEGAIFSLRSSLSVARSFLHQICLCLCKAGSGPRNAVLSWFGTVLNLNRKRSAMQVDYKDVSADGFMLNVMHVLLKLCEPIVGGGWAKLQKIDPTFPQSSHRLDYEEETRLAADSDMLKRWWVDKRNENAQESLTRQLEAAARESGVIGHAGQSAAGAASSSTNNADQQAVATEFNFVTECFWLALRSIHLGFITVANLYEETILQTLQRMKDMIQDMELAKEAGTLPQNEIMQLTLLKAKMDSLLQAKLCYDVYIQDPETLASLLRFSAADAEWLVKKLLANPPRESLLPLPVPADPTFASLPEHTVEIITSVLLTTMRFRPEIVDDNSSLLEDIITFCIAGSASPLHVKNPYLRAKLIEFLWTIFPRGTGGVDDEDDEPQGNTNAAMESLFAGHILSRKFLPGALFRLYVDVEHTGSHTQFYDKFSIRYRIASIIESLWYMADYRKSVRNEARDESRFLRFVNMVLNDAIHLLDSVLDDLEEVRSLEVLMDNAQEWQSLSDEERNEKQDRLRKLRGSARSYNLLANNNVKLLWLLTDDEVVRRIFLRDEMVSRLAEMLNYLLERMCGQRCRDLIVSEPAKVSWKPRQLLKRLVETYAHFRGDETFAKAVGRDGRSYKKELLPKAIAIVSKRRLVSQSDIEWVKRIAEKAEQALEEDMEEEENLGEVPDEFLDPIMSSLMRNPVRLPTSGNIMDRAVISRILLSDKVDPFNRKFLSEDMLEDEVDLKKQIDAFIAERRKSRRGNGSKSGEASGSAS